MKRLLMIFAALIVAAMIGISIQRYPAVLVIGFGEWRIDIPFWLAVLLLVLFYVVFHVIVEGLRAILSAARSLAHFGRHYRKHRAKALVKKGLMALNEGNYGMAEKALEQSAQDSDLPWFSYFSAAKAAQALDQEMRADRYLSKAQTLAPETAFSVALLQARYFLKKKQYKEVITLLSTWNEKKPNHSLVLDYLQRAYYETQQWGALVVLLPKLKRHQVLSKEAYQQLEREVWKKELLSNDKAWKDLPHYLQVDLVIALTYAKSLVKNKEYAQAESILKQAIKHEWDEKLVRYYGRIPHCEPEKSLSTAEGWIARHPESPALLSTLGRLCVQAQLWGKAQRYFEASLSLLPDPVIYAELATLLEKINKPELSMQYYKKAALLPHYTENEK